MSIKGSQVFAIEGSHVDYIERQIPNYNRGTILWLSQYRDDSYQLYAIPAFLPGITKDSVSLYLEGGGQNEVIKNTNFDPDHSAWVKSTTSVIVRPNTDLSPMGEYTADRLVIDGSVAEPQYLSLPLELEAGKTYTLQIAASLQNGTPDASDQILVEGDVDSSIPIPIQDLAAYYGKMRLLSTTFTVSGTELDEDNFLTEISLNVTNVTAQTVTMSGFDVQYAANELVGARIKFVLEGETETTDEPDINVVPDDILYTITAHTQGDAASNNSVTFTVSAGDDLVGDGITTSHSAELVRPEKKNIIIKIYSESILSISLGFIDIKEGDFKKSPIIQDAVKVSDPTTCIYRKTPISLLENFSFLLDLEHWEGDGNIFTLEEIYVVVENGSLTVNIGSFQQTIPVNSAFTLFVTVSSEQRIIRYYLDGILYAQSTIGINVQASAKAFLDLSTIGVKKLRRLIFFNKAFPDPLGGVVGEAPVDSDLVTVLNEDNIISQETISSPPPTVSMGIVTLDGRKDPDALAVITSITGSNVTVDPIDQYGNLIETIELTNGATVVPVKIEEQGGKIKRTPLSKRTITAIAGTDPGDTLTLDSTLGLELNMILYEGNYDDPTTSSVRFTVDPVDRQEIEAIDEPNKKITIATATPFYLGGLYAYDQGFQDIGEFNVLDIDQVNRQLTLSSVDGLSVGDVVLQPESELVIHPANYYVSLLRPVEGVAIAEKYNNSVVLKNSNIEPTEAEVIITVNL